VKFIHLPSSGGVLGVELWTVYDADHLLLLLLLLPLLLLLLLQVMDKHMGLLCKQHLETKFVKVRLNSSSRAGWQQLFLNVGHSVSNIF
jgi:hypothetical protein